MDNGGRGADPVSAAVATPCFSRRRFVTRRLPGGLEKGDDLPAVAGGNAVPTRFAHGSPFAHRRELACAEPLESVEGVPAW
jgi:hypothetical protein